MTSKRESRPGQASGAAPKTTTTKQQVQIHSSLYRTEDGYSAPTPDDRIDADVIAAAKARGFSIAVRCTRCNQWVVASRSVAAHMGPVCRAKAVADDE